MVTSVGSVVGHSVVNALSTVHLVASLLTASAPEDTLTKALVPTLAPEPQAHALVLPHHPTLSQDLVLSH
jgi:hypothetical protein